MFQEDLTLRKVAACFEDDHDLKNALERRGEIAFEPRFMDQLTLRIRKAPNALEEEPLAEYDCVAGGFNDLKLGEGTKFLSFRKMQPTWRR